MKKSIFVIFLASLIFVSCSTNMNAEKTVKNVISSVKENNLEDFKNYCPWWKSKSEEDFSLYFNIWQDISNSNYKIKTIKDSEPAAPVIRIETKTENGKSGNSYEVKLNFIEDSYYLDEDINVIAKTQFIDFIDFSEEN